MKKIALIGGGNMAEAIIGGIQKSDKQYNLGVFEPNQERIAFLKSRFPQLKIYASNKELIHDQQDIIILAVKPQAIDVVMAEITDSPQKTIMLSIAAGINMSKIKSYCPNSKIVRCMPNTPFLVGAGCGGICFDENITASEKSNIIELFSNCGKLFEVEEKDMHLVTALSGSGPAYFFNFVEHLISSSVSLGLDPKIAKELAILTAYGAGKLMIENNEEPATLRQKVTSPKGTTEAALLSFNKSNFENIVSQALKAANDRSIELSK